MEIKRAATIILALVVFTLLLILPQKQGEEQKPESDEIKTLSESIISGAEVADLEKLRMLFHQDQHRQEILALAKQEYDNFGSLTLLAKIISGRNDLTLALLTSDDRVLEKMTVLAMDCLDEKIVGELKNLFSRDDSALKNAIILHLGKTKDINSKDMLLKALTVPALRKNALVALELLDDSGVLPEIEIHFADQDKMVRLQAYKTALSLSRDPLGLLKKALVSSDWEIRVLALTNMQKIKTGAGMELVIKHLQDPVEDVRVQAVKTLGLQGIKGSEQYLVTALEDDSAEVRGEAAMSLVLLNARDKVEVLKSIMAEEKMVYALRRMIIALGHLGSSKDLPALEIHKQHKHHLIREVVETAISNLMEKN